MLLLSCCYRSMSTPNEILISRGRPVTLQQAQETGLSPVIERMMNLTEHLRRLQVDQHEFVCLKVIILLTSDVSGLKEPDKVRTCQKQMLEVLQAYIRSHYPHLPSKFGELLLRIPELERVCQVGKEPLVGKQRGGDVPSFHLLLELLRGDY
ncbi:nuclear hormone receptor FTZ-F1 beta-like [Tachypleus tridentatus]|uniref:nuclear hormone receptor FTZ-F1 beta-like n=1 Tax=Tachypleus tridentatus TaxID=6853 RepID=UPI003FD14128